MKAWECGRLTGVVVVDTGRTMRVARRPGDVQCTRPWLAGSPLHTCHEVTLAEVRQDWMHKDVQRSIICSRKIKLKQSNCQLIGYWFITNINYSGAIFKSMK